MPCWQICMDNWDMLSLYINKYINCSSIPPFLSILLDPVPLPSKRWLKQKHTPASHLGTQHSSSSQCCCWMRTGLARAAFSSVRVPVLMQVLSVQTEGSRCLGCFFLEQFKLFFSKVTETESECMPIDEMGNASMCEPHVKTFAADLKLKDIRDPSSELDANSGSKSAIPTPGFNFH